MLQTSAIQNFERPALQLPMLELLELRVGGHYQREAGHAHVGDLGFLGGRGGCALCVRMNDLLAAYGVTP